MASYIIEQGLMAIHFIATNNGDISFCRQGQTYCIQLILSRYTLLHEIESE